MPNEENKKANESPNSEVTESISGEEEIFDDKKNLKEKYTLVYGEKEGVAFFYDNEGCVT